MSSVVRHRPPLWVWLLALGAAPLPIYLLLAPYTLARELVYDLTITIVLSIATVVVWRRPRNRGASLAILSGHWMFLAGDLVFTIETQLLDRESLSWVGDVFYLSGYPLIAVGLMSLMRSRGARHDLGGLVDGAIVAVGFGVLLWVWLMAPSVGGADLGVAERWISIGYPAGGLLLVTMGAQLALSHGRRLVPFWLLGGGLSMMLVADLGYAHAVIDETESALSALDAAWWLGYLLVAAAVTHPRAEELAQAPDRPVPTRLSNGRLVTLAVASLAAPAFLAVRTAGGSFEGAPELLVATMALFILVVVRITLANRDLHDSSAALLHEATHDALTGLANRSLLHEMLARSLTRRHPAGRHTAVMCLDLDDFKVVNDTLGHAAGDQLLRVFARRLEALLRPGDSVARLGGDEFVIVIDDATPEATLDIAARIHEEIQRPIDVGAEHPAYTNTSIGIRFSDPGDTAELVLRDADTAMYLAKAQGKGQRQVFRAGMRQQVVERLELRSELSVALVNNELVLHYQPVTDINTGALRGVEALLHWEHPLRGHLGADRFVPIAEESGRIVEIGTWVLHEACRQAQSWPDGSRTLEMAVNISPIQLADSGLVGAVSDALQLSGLAPHRLLLELTESSVVEDVDRAAATLHELRSLGVRIALDDFGTGSTSIRHLGAFPIDVVKFDRRFVNSAHTGETRLLAALMELAATLKIDTVAEGVETTEQHASLKAMGCQYVQGFLISPAISPAQLRTILAVTTVENPGPLTPWPLQRR